ncbi:L-aspartate oxidase [Bacillus cihuensis]|uniref:L-aspartate oxidase n=1 Tax=Bacillus cihuensis TaxID=1208599 RepID=UPI00040FB879|nr:L-aspartate oxidase [Bacillus cihuensis]
MDPVDVLIVGSGVAALQTAFTASKTKHVILITKSELRQCNSYLAQGGVACAIANDDKPELHKIDTVCAGRNYNNRLAVDKLVNEGPVVMQELMHSGMVFDCNEHGLPLLGLEGAHSQRRILHRHGDATGKHLMEHYLKRLAKSSIHVMEHTAAIELILGEDDSCIGVKTMSKEGKINSIYAKAVVLATGGCGSLFQFTSNSPTVSGDGIALAFKAGARIRDMEFIQFHPTLLYINGKTVGLVSEAVRGEGAELVSESGKRIMNDVHPQKELAPRHIVAQTIYAYLKNGEQVYLDISMIADFKKRFPTIAALCENNGQDLTKARIPVAPGNHFLMGGIEVDEWGRTSVKGLYAVGEVACTGVHGANRLASNSLLEGLVFGKSVGRYLAEAPERVLPIEKKQTKRALSHLILPNLTVIQANIMNDAGIVRNQAKLSRLLSWLESFNIEALLFVDVTQLALRDIERINAVIVSWLIAYSAIERTESRGGHFRTDYPFEHDEDWREESVVLDRNRAIHQLKGRELYEQIKA